MIDESQVISAIKELYDGKAVSFSKIKKKLKADNEELSLILDRLQEEGKIRKITSGGGKSYELIEKEIDKNDIILKEIRELKDEIKKLQEYIVEKKKISENSFDEIYDKVKDNLGYAHLQHIRLELGLSKEDFYSRMREHIEKYYDLIAGGEEGYVRKGSIYGIIKKR
ncbi:hypothetical protein DFR86_01420 [Acidianus sulfidivorans JP7]|uniref:Uncharacterized protein n=1 Tax=Acidianus sulfidivorans JP7 TaxID=619593 RepID=A0A2U9IK21_9CREN|nr:hypothetical protein [Acidianus sulfidivorans]AWR96335.1 hypothetical protein DFR86_01420 [Acidianus sulfidivorans JP7]